MELEDINLEDIETASVELISNVKDLNEKKIDDIIKELFSDDEDNIEDNIEDKEVYNKKVLQDNDNSDKDNSIKDKSEINLEKEHEIKEHELKKENGIRNDLTWLPLNKKWSEKLMSNKFMIKDNTEGDINTALTHVGYKMDTNKLRRIIGKYINKLENGDFYNILQNYKIKKQNGVFKDNWNPFYVKSKRQFINNIINSSFHDEDSLQLLSKALGVDFIIFDNSYNIIDLSESDNLNDKLIILFKESIKENNNENIYYKTIGLNLVDNKIQTLFKRNKLPREIDIILDKHTFLLEHIKELYGGSYNKKDIKLNKILYDLQEKLDLKLTKSDKRKIMVILRNWLQNLDYFKKINTTIK